MAKKTKTIGGVIMSNKWLDFTFGGCKTIGNVKPPTVHLKRNIEVEALGKFRPCPHCNYSIDRNNEPLLLIGVE